MLRKVSIPNALTLFRIGIIPVILICVAIQTKTTQIIGLVLFVIAGITDYFDGFLARYLNQVSSFGKIFDPIADKLIIVLVLIEIVVLNPLINRWTLVPIMLIVGREILVSGFRSYQPDHMPVSFLAKIKTVFQIIVITLLIFTYIIHSHLLLLISEIALWLVSIYTLFTLGQYVYMYYVQQK